MFAEEVKKHLIEDLIPFWRNLRDNQYGGYFSYMDYDLTVDKKAVKGCILNSRILWFFSNTYKMLQEASLLEEAEHAYKFLLEHCLDKVNGGIYWSVSYDGTALDKTKHTYNQAFALYALSSYYEVAEQNKKEEILTLAEHLFDVIEKKCMDRYGYLEAFDEYFYPIENQKLSENGVLAEKTMNTLLHVFEAYTEFYRVTKKKELKQRLTFILDLFCDKVYNPKLKRQEVFFSNTWDTLIDLHSYGHDIETAWLLDRGLAILEDRNYQKKVYPITEALTENIYERAYKNHSLLNECENGFDDTKRVWWVQAEAIVGFLNGYEKNRSKKEYLEAAKDIWNYIKNNLIDKRNGSEWFWSLDEYGNPSKKPIVEPWKCPYHNGRMCLEVIRRLNYVS